ncbi:hypothetical protein cypCar_00038363, partial [Cyprinus carpio]
LDDLGNGSSTVNITDLQESDSGIYWCGVKRPIRDTYDKVTLTVSKGCVIARSIYNSRHSEETNAVYQNAPDDRPYATINKSSTKSKDESQSDPIYQNIHFNTTQEETIYGNL